MPIDPIQSRLHLTPVTSGAQLLGTSASEGPGFSSIIGDALQQVDRLQQQANEASTMVATGQSADLHTALLRVEEAGLAMQLALQVRNKVVESYQEIMRMPV
jgi:flagellar hook-basal body complex protein FliE